MDSASNYFDLSLLAERIIDVPYFLQKVKNDRYSTVALDYQLIDPKPNISLLLPPTIQGVKLLKRITLIVENTSSLHPLGQSQNPYDSDILAIKPMNEKIFHTICTEYDTYDIITFDIGNKLPFMLKRNPVYEAIRKGKYFQISYESLFDEQKRVVAMTNMVNIIKATNGKNIIVSSHSSQNGTHRSPYEVAAMLVSLGLDKNKALACMKQNCQQVVKSGQHRLYLKGAVKQISGEMGRKLSKKIQKHRQKFRQIERRQRENKNIQESNKD